jgi:outer membrane protein TolC
MRFGNGRFARLGALLASGAMTACTSAAVQTSIQTAESKAEPHALAASAAAPVPAPAASGSGESPRAAQIPAVDEAALERSLDLQSLEVAALARQPSLVAAAHRIRALTERARAEGKLPPPELMADIWQVPFAKPYALDKAGMIMFTLRQQFPAPGVLDKMSEAMALEAQAEAEKAVGEARAVVREVDRAFASYVEASARHAAHEAHRAIVEQMIAAARARYETRGSLGDFTRADLEKARTDAEIERERGMLDEARARLNGLLARAADAKLGPPQASDVRTTALTPEQAASIAAAQNPEVKMAERMEKSARATAEAASREANVPMFSAGFSTFLPVNDMPVGYGLSFSMSLPWAWGAASGRAKSAEQKALAERANVDAAKLRMRTDAAMALAAVRAAERRYLRLQDSALPAAQRAVDATRAGYAAGGADILMWLDASRMALDVELDLAMARGDLDRALADLDFAAGGHVARAPLSASKETSHVK